MEPGGDVTLDEFTGLLAELDRSSAHGVLVATDEEGGTVQRLRQYRSLPSQRDVAATMSPDEAAELITGHGAFVSESGVDVVLGPVVDVAPADGSPALEGSRFFSGSPDDVTDYAAAYVEGWQANGLLPTLKHFPGHGAASADTHDALGVTPLLDELELRDLVPYRSLAATAAENGTPVAVMVGHLDVPGLTATEPASLSSAAVELLRREIGFDDALVISDALEMGAVDLRLPDAAVASIGAGVDVVLFSDTAATGAVIDAIVTAVEGDALPDDRLADAADRVLRSQRDRDCGSGNS
jgi:beta-N-acetylhexosaminidase